MSTIAKISDSPYFADYKEIGSTYYSAATLGYPYIPQVTVPNASLIKKYSQPVTHDWPHFNSWLQGGPASLNDAVFYIGHFIKAMPCVMDLAYDVDGGGYTNRTPGVCNATAWIPSGYGSDLYLRFSTARTALHRSGVLRSPVMGGYALEATRCPVSGDPRDAVTVLVFEKPREQSPTQSWLTARDAKVYSFVEFTETPYFVGPLYNGHPNEIQNARQIAHVLGVARTLVNLTMQ